METEEEANFALALVLVLATERAAHMVISMLMTMRWLFLATDPGLATILTLATILDHAPALVNQLCLREAIPQCRVRTPHRDIPVQSLQASLPASPQGHIHLMAVETCRCQFSIPHQPDPCLVWLHLLCQWFCADGAHQCRTLRIHTWALQ
jgi:hypothetical protein